MWRVVHARIVKWLHAGKALPRPTASRRQRRAILICPDGSAGRVRGPNARETGTPESFLPAPASRWGSNSVKRSIPAAFGTGSLDLGFTHWAAVYDDAARFDVRSYDEDG